MNDKWVFMADDGTLWADKYDQYRRGKEGAAFYWTKNIEEAFVSPYDDNNDQPADGKSGRWIPLHVARARLGQTVDLSPVFSLEEIEEAQRLIAEG